MAFDLAMISTFVLIALAIFIVGIFARIISLQRKSKEIEKTLDYSKMREWEDEEN